MKTLTLLVMIGLIIQSHGQQLQGVATYKAHRKVDLKMDNDKMSDDIKKQIQEQLRKQFQQEYTLKFNNHESIYKKEDKLDAPNPMASSGFIINVSESSSIYYKNVKEKRYSKKTEMFGKVFLIKDSLSQLKWQLVNETKNIGEYTCFKATYTDEVTSNTMNEKGEMETIKKPKTVVVWYTPQIPISNGPLEYYGLPGLILDVDDGDLTLVCTKIVLNPAEGIEILEPDKGKQVSKEEFQEISDKKIKEQMERFQLNSRRHGDGRRIMIGVGG